MPEEEGVVSTPGQAIRRTIVANEKESDLTDERRKKFREAIYRDYDGSVLRTDFFPTLR